MFGHISWVIRAQVPYRSPALFPYFIACSNRGRFARMCTLSKPETMEQNRTCARLSLHQFEEVLRSQMTRTIFLQSCHVAQQFAMPALQDRPRIDVTLFALRKVNDGNKFFRQHRDPPPKAQKNPWAVPGDIPDLQISV